MSEHLVRRAGFGRSSSARRRREHSLAVALAVALLSVGCGGAEKKPTPPAKVEGARPEAELATITLTPQAEARLGVTLAKVEQRTVLRVHEVGGEVVAPSNRALTVLAPLPGILLPPAAGEGAAPGARVRRGQVLFRLAPLPPADRELQRDRAREEADTAHARLEATRANAERARKLREVGAGSVRAEEEAKARQAEAEAALRSARSRLELLSGTDLDETARRATAIEVEAPRDGVLMDVSAAPGLSVPAGSPLARIVSDDVLWVQVSVYTGQLDKVDTTAPARVSRLGAPADQALIAHPVTAPPRADPVAATADITFALPGGGARMRPGERVMVSLPLRESEEALVVPWSAVLYDVEGGTWVYEALKPHVFARRRVELRYVSDALAVLSRGPAPGTSVVATGAAELFGTEFGAK